MVLGEFVGAHLFLVYRDAEAGAEGDVEVAVAQGRRQVGRLRAGEQQVVQHQFGEFDAVAQRAGGRSEVQLGRDLDAEPPRRADHALQTGGFGDRRDLLGLVQAARLGDLDVDDVRRLRADDLICTTSCGVQAYSP